MNPPGQFKHSTPCLLLLCSYIYKAYITPINRAYRPMHTAILYIYIYI